MQSLKTHNIFLNKLKPKYFFVLILILLVIDISNTSTAYPQATQEELKGKVNSISEQIKKLEAEIATYQSTVSKTKEQAATLKEAIARLEDKKKNLNKEIAVTGYKIENTTSNLQSVSEKIIEAENRINFNKSAMEQSFRDQLMSQNEGNLITKLLSENNLSNSINRLNSELTFNEQLGNRVEEVTNLKNTLDSAKKVYEQEKTVLENLQDDLSDKKYLVEQSKKENDALLAKTKNKEAEYQKLIADRKKKKTGLEAEMSDAENKLKMLVDASKIPLIGNILKYPVKKIIITQYFGNTPFASKNPQVYNGSGHNGIDLGVPEGSGIYSAADGVVVGTGNTDSSCSGVSYGKWILIKHNNGLSTLYAHLSSIQVSEGQAVTVGQKIALSGNTGYSTGPHLHFTVYASDAVAVSNYTSKVCGTIMRMPLAPKAAYLNPLTYL